MDHERVVHPASREVLKYGLNHVTTLVEQKLAKLAGTLNFEPHNILNLQSRIGFSQQVTGQVL